jgi:ribosomal protein S18 acetylase RimI-like enzyme
MDFHKNMDALFNRMKDGHLHFEKHVKDLLISDNHRVFVTLNEGNVLAYPIVQVMNRPPGFQSQKFGFISDMVVKREYQRRGIGERMLSKIFEWFKSRSIYRIELRVVAKNQAGYSFWKKHGFRDYTHTLCLDLA